ncbi:hypothetical protein [Pseudoalteromonas sp. P1-8]|uniref:hypothetical protein n=1 Tax=Pseudoalteromonas sp. P1-8 TaxID=1710353 RepID=UPI0006DC54D5|nr:hypothetical protein [Pseudoalteromonas sp. P1-8]KPV99027.1 hypothetical protein AN213_03224 [Pseudoalteromonas sp. P1-8]
MKLISDSSERNEKHQIVINGKVKWELPADMCNHNFLLLYWDYTKSRLFLNLSYARRQNLAGKLTNFLDFTVELIKKYGEVPHDIFARYTNHLKNTTKQTGNGLISSVTSVLYVLKLYGGQKEKKSDSEYWLPEFYVMITKTPSFTWEETQPRDSLSTKFDLGFTSKEMIDSLLLLSSYIINTFDEKRKLLLQNKKLEEAALESFKISSFSYPTYALSADLKNKVAKVSRRLYGELARTILALNDDWLIERFMHENPCPDVFLSNEPDVRIRRKEWLNKLVNKSTGDMKTLVAINKKKYRLQTIKSYCMNDLYGLSHEAVFAMQCILACHRIQTSGVERMSFNDVISNNKGVQFKYYKGRGKKRFATDVLKKGSQPYKATQIYLEHFKQQHPGDNPKLIQYHKVRGTTDNLGQIGKHKANRLNHFFIDLLDESTELHKHMKMNLGKDSVPILALLKKIVENNLSAAENSINYRISEDKGFISLSIDSIARARVEADDAKHRAPALKESSEYRKPVYQEKAEKEVEALLTAHNLETKQNIYNARSRSPEKLESMRRFAAQVGDTMEQDARAVEKLFNKTKVLDLKAVTKLLGIEGTINEQEDLYDIVNKELGNVVGDIGDINVEGKRIVIETPLTAALITSKISHINSEIPRLKLDSEKKALKAQMHRAYLSTLLAEFSSSIIKEGKLMSRRYKFPFSPMV